MNGQDTPRVTDQIRTREYETCCPYCEAWEDGWVVNPRGQTTQCDSCGETYTVANNAVIQGAT